VHAWAAPSDPASSAPEPLAIAREALTKLTFTGTVLVSWFDGKRTHSQRVPVDDDNGLLVVGSARRVMTDGDEGVVREGDGWAALGADAAARSKPAPTQNYRFVSTPDDSVAGRNARVIEAVQLKGSLRERFSLDRDTGVLLRREQIEGGRSVRTVEFVSISGLRPATTPPPTLPDARHRASNVSTDNLDRRWHVPRDIGEGFELVDAHRHSDGALQLYYSDGLHGLSLFEKRGRLDHDALPGSGRDTTVNGHSVRVYDNAAGRTLVWDTSTSVYACVTDAPPGAVPTLLQKFPAHRGRGALTGLMHFVLAPFSWE
jgi:hypothetical protein